MYTFTLGTHGLGFSACGLFKIGRPLVGGLLAVDLAGGMLAGAL
jgi:hypothetical protein